MNKMIIKRGFCILLTVILLVSMYIPTYADNKSEYVLSWSLNEFFKTDYDNYLIERRGASHMVFVENNRNSKSGTLAMKVLGFFCETGYEPDEARYMEVLINIMKTYETENAEAIAEQHKMDNLKTAGEYAIDVVDIAAGLAGFNKATDDLSEWIDLAVGSLSTLKDNTNEWAQGIGDLQTVIQNYARHDDFLRLIELRGSGELKTAASKLRTSLQKAMEIKLEKYSEISQNNFNNYTEYIFEDALFYALKQTKEYKTDDAFKKFADLGSNVVSVWKAIKVGAEIGKFIANIAINADSIVDRVLEMKAVYDISDILEGELKGIQKRFPKSNYTYNSEEDAKSYISYGNYLISGRIRGEYCLYSMLAKDSRLYSYFGDETAKMAESKYNALTVKLSDVKQSMEAGQNVLYVNTGSATGISSLSDEELKDIASDVIKAWEEYENYGIVCQRENIANENDIEPYLTEEQRGTNCGIEKCICCKTKGEAKIHLERYLDLTSIYADPTEGYSADYMYSLTDKLLCEHDGELYWIMPAKGSVGYGTDHLVINRIDENTFSAISDMYGSGNNYCDTYEFFIKHNGENYVAFKINEVSGPTFLSNVNENVVLPYYYESGSSYYVDADGGLNMRYGPGQNYEKIMLIPNGAKVINRGDNESYDWCFIEYDGQFGWVAKEFIKYRYD